MNFPVFIARRISGVRKNSFSGLIIKIATIAVALSLAVMLLSTAFVNGFKKEITKKVFGFNGHIKIHSYDSNKSMEDQIPISRTMDAYDSIKELEDVAHIQVFANKIGVIKKDEIIEGIVLRGIGSDFNWDEFSNFVIEGQPFIVNDTARSNDILLSSYTAKRLKVKVGDDLIAYFVENRIRYRKFTVVGLYKTGLEDFDERFALIDIAQIQKLNGWEKDDVGGLMVSLNDIGKLTETNEEIYYKHLEHDIRSSTVKETNPGIFDWLELQGTNESIIMILMVIVAIINMITALLILILERTNMIGILKALGASNRNIRGIFLYKAARIIGFGMLFGNIVGLGLSALQYYFHFIKLPEESYYMSYAPVEFNLGIILLINLGTFIIALSALLIPSYLVSWINPVKAIRFD